VIFDGVYTALITPFAHGKVDHEALAALCLRVLPHSAGLVVLGTTGEPCALRDREKLDVVRTVRSVCGKPIVVGVTGNDTATVQRRAVQWQREGASALLLVTPYYNRCSQEGLLAHYAAVCRAVDIPVVVYNVPARTGVNIAPDTLARILSLPHVEAVKEANADPRQIVQYATICHQMGKTLLCGEDALLPLFRAAGARGVISAAANAIPSVMAEGMRVPMTDAVRWLCRYGALLDALFAEVNPICVKQACYHLGLVRNELRLPLTPAYYPRIPTLLQEAGFAIINQ